MCMGGGASDRMDIYYAWYQEHYNNLILQIHIFNVKSL